MNELPMKFNETADMQAYKCWYRRIDIQTKRQISIGRPR